MILLFYLILKFCSLKCNYFVALIVSEDIRSWIPPYQYHIHCTFWENLHVKLLLILSEVFLDLVHVIT